MSEAACWLCGERTTLLDSHVIPKFVFRWLKSTGGTPYLRNGANPNVRRQDGDKHKLYCKNCEARISQWENLASQRLFLPATRREDLPERYGAWLSRFAASLALRTVQSQMYRDVLDKYPKSDIESFTRAAEVWKKFLLGEVAHPSKFKLYLCHIGYFDTFDAEGLPSNWNTWVKRSVERDTLFSESGKFLAAFTKLGPLVFLGTVRDEENSLGEAFLRCNEGVYPKPTQLLNSSVWPMCCALGLLRHS